MPKSSYYYAIKSKAKTDKYAELKHLILFIFENNKRRYGHRRILAVLKNDYCIQINHKTVMRLMNELNLHCPIRDKKYRAIKFGKDSGTTSPNIIKRNFEAEAPNMKWTSDITTFKMFNTKIYLAAIMDMYNTEIVGYELSDSPNMAMVQTMLDRAFEKLPKETKNLIFHSDRGWHYQQRFFQSALQSRSIIQSMSRKGNCYDNAIMETFFASLKSELFYIEKFESIEHLKSEIHKYIEYYNHQRIKERLNYLSPIQYKNINYSLSQL